VEQTQNSTIMTATSLNTKTPFVNGFSIPFEQFPSIMIELLLRVEQLEKLQSSIEIQVQPNDDVLNIDEASFFLGLSKQTIYKKVRNNEIPFSKPSKRLFFSKKELNDYKLGKNFKRNFDDKPFLKTRNS
jgi:excisionase family DNA binding protein